MKIDIFRISIKIIPNIELTKIAYQCNILFAGTCTYN